MYLYNKKHHLFVGTLSRDGSRLNEKTHVHAFEAVELATIRGYDAKERGALDPARGLRQTLYRALDLRLLVHTETWNLRNGAQMSFTLEEINKEDLQPGGKYQDLGFEAGYWDTDQVASSIYTDLA